MTRPLVPGQAATAPKHPANTSPLSGRLLVLAQAAWLVIALAAFCLFIAAIPAEFAQLRVPCPTAACPTTGQLPPAGLRALGDLGLSLDFFAAYSVAVDIVFAAVYAAVAALIFWRKPEDRMGLFVSLALLTFGTATFPLTMAALAVRHPVSEIPVDFLHFLGSASFGLFLYLFPDGRFVPRWTRWVALAWIAWQLPPYFFPEWHLNPDVWYLWAQAVLWPVGLGTALYAQAYRYRWASSATQRQQIKWVVFGIGLALSVFICLNLALSVFAPAPTSPSTLATLLIAYLFVYGTLLLIPLSISI